MIDIKLVTFITVAKTKNLTRAADILRITQPAVSQHIKALEDYFNVKLLYKKGKQMEVTEEGQLLLKQALELNRLSKTIKTKLKNKSSIKRKYYVGATLTIGGYVLPKIIGEHKKNHQNIDIMLYVDNTETIIERLFNGDIILGLLEGPFDISKVNYKKFKDDELVLAVSPDHKFASKEYVTIDEVLSSKLILREQGSGTRKIFENELKKSGYKLDNMNVYMEIGDIRALISLVESNLGCTIISKEAIKSSIQANTLKIIPISNFKILREFNFVYLDRTCDSFIDEFIQFCLDGG